MIGYRTILLLLALTVTFQVCIGAATLRSAQALLQRHIAQIEALSPDQTKGLIQ
jgi:hypothetical protein